MSKYGVYSVPHFPASGLNTEKISQFSPNTVKYGPEKNSVFGHFSHNVHFEKCNSVSYGLILDVKLMKEIDH